MTTDRDQVVQALLAAAGVAMPPWQARMFRKLMEAAAAGKLPRNLPLPPRGTLPPITVHQLRRPGNGRAKKPKPQPRQRSLPL